MSKKMFQVFLIIKFKKEKKIMSRINKAKNFAGKSYVVSNEVESLIKSLSFDKNILKFSAAVIGEDSVALGDGVDFSTWINEAKAVAASSAVTTVVGTNADTKDADTVYGAKAYAKNLVDGVSAAAIGVKAGDGISIVT